MRNKCKSYDANCEEKRKIWNCELESMNAFVTINSVQMLLYLF